MLVGLLIGKAALDGEISRSRGWCMGAVGRAWFASTNGSSVLTRFVVRVALPPNSIVASLGEHISLRRAILRGVVGLGGLNCLFGTGECTRIVPSDDEARSRWLTLGVTGSVISDVVRSIGVIS